jgi:hypothetical protein
LDQGRGFPMGKMITGFWDNHPEDMTGNSRKEY